MERHGGWQVPLTQFLEQHCVPDVQPVVPSVKQVGELAQWPVPSQ